MTFNSDIDISHVHSKEECCMVIHIMPIIEFIIVNTRAWLLMEYY